MGSFYLDITAEERVNNPKNLLNEALFKTIGQGQNEKHSRPDRKPYKKLSNETKGLVSALAEVSGVKQTAKAFDIHPATVSSLKRGMSTDGQRADTQVREQKESVLDQIGGKASVLVSDVLSRLVDPTRLASAKTAELATVAGVAMNILEKTQPKRPDTFIAGKVVFMVPPTRTIEQYDVIDVDPVVE